MSVIHELVNDCGWNMVEFTSLIYGYVCMLMRFELVLVVYEVWMKNEKIVGFSEKWT